MAAAHLALLLKCARGSGGKATAREVDGTRDATLATTGNTEFPLPQFVCLFLFVFDFVVGENDGAPARTQAIGKWVGEKWQKNARGGKRGWGMERHLE